MVYTIFRKKSMMGVLVSMHRKRTIESLALSMKTTMRLKPLFHTFEYLQGNAGRIHLLVWKGFISKLMLPP